MRSILVHWTNFHDILPIKSNFIHFFSCFQLVPTILKSGLKISFKIDQQRTPSMYTNIRALNFDTERKNASSEMQHDDIIRSSYYEQIIQWQWYHYDSGSDPWKIAFQLKWGHTFSNKWIWNVAIIKHSSLL